MTLLLRTIVQRRSGTWREFGERGAIYNVASGVSTSIAEIVEIYLSLARMCVLSK